MVVSSLVHIGLCSAINPFIFVGQAIHIQLISSHMTRLDEDLLATRVRFGVIGDISECPPGVFFVPCSSIEYANGHFQCRHLQFVILSCDCTIDVKWKGHKNLVGLGDQSPVSDKICLAGVQVFHKWTGIGWCCKWILVEVQPILILPTRISQQGHDVISRKLLPYGEFG